MRVLIALCFLLANLTTQVDVAYSCAMMGGARMELKVCCCHPDEAVGSAHEVPAACCDRVVEVAGSLDGQVGTLPAPIRLPDRAPQPIAPVLLPELLSWVVPASPRAPVRDERRDHSLPGTNLYLRTQRLRL